MPYFLTNVLRPDKTIEMSSKSATSSPMLARVSGAGPSARSTSDLVRDFWESSEVPPPGISGRLEDEDRESVVGRFTKSESQSTLSSRSESMASVYSQGEGRYGTVMVKGEVEFGFIYSFSSGSLEIAIKQCTGLAAVDSKRNRSDP